MIGPRDLESRINARCVELMVRLEELEADTRAHAAETCDKLGATLSDLRRILAAGLVDGGWGNLADRVGIELDRWLSESASHLEVSTKGTP